MFCKCVRKKDVEEEKSKTIYFVRHAESEANVADDRFQDSTSQLSAEGLRQAEVLAERVSNISVDMIISSTMKRARQTSEIVAKKIAKPVVYTDLLHEARLPSVYYGKRRDDPEILKLQGLYMQNRFDKRWRLADEENFEDRKARAKKILAYLLGFKEEKILVVTHGTILRITIAFMMFDDDLTPIEYHKVVPFLHMTNTGITVCTHNKKEGWRMLTWNDRAHFG
ncbi:MAG: putative phosphoglycerate mutase [Parcubacteria group bacterium Gr01-1014_70]|nr:MAG: putative phosphoglycerate mutase [Parcubacteria group bacterium Gr01-1014_70]